MHMLLILLDLCLRKRKNNPFIFNDLSVFRESLLMLENLMSN
jgi:hypothetical protein